MRSFVNEILNVTKLELRIPLAKTRNYEDEKSFLWSDEQTVEKYFLRGVGPR